MPMLLHNNGVVLVDRYKLMVNLVLFVSHHYLYQFSTPASELII